MKRFYLVCIAILCILLLPIMLWFLEPNEKVSIAIIDKTVSDDSYREHLGLTWLLNHLKYSNGDEAYDASSDYFGFTPNNKEKIRALPDDYSNYDVIYLADTYGVHEGSSEAYGGLEQEEWNNILKRLNDRDKSLLIAEFNTFAYPTEPPVRESVENYLGLQWTGWTGRYFEDLDPTSNEEIPNWVIDSVEDWSYAGEGFVLVNDKNDVIVLESDQHFGDKGIQVSFTKDGKAKFDLEKSADYKYWFDIVVPQEGTKVLANYQWDLTEAGKSLLEEYSIPTEFAAVLAREQSNSSSYYFAGDFNDIAKVPAFYQLKGLANIYKFAERFADNAFYWSTYAPMMKVILEDFHTSEGTNMEDGLGYNARVKGETFEVYENDQWKPLTIKGVNIGMGKPGYFPGEAAITEEEYYRWFKQIGEMHANMVRVYTLHPPGFYNALKRYNKEHENKIYVLHGVWINEEKLEESLDAFEEENLKDFQTEMKTIVDVIHGNKIVKERPGHASGVYNADVSEYIAGWVLGIEWYPYMVLNTNEKHSSIGEYDGTYFETKGARPFEYWLAEQMDTIVKYEKESYNWVRPMSFTNWVTTDILEHPAEPAEQEDLVGVDPNVIYTKNEMKLTEQFASYHVYPYYPDFFNYEESYQKFVDHRGEFNSYAAYLKKLHEVHRMPILIAEFGVPGSRGLTHKNPFGWNQGFHSEEEQGKIISRLFEDIMAEKLLGGLVFTWQDEWFKRTWNTVDYDNPDRRPYWSNAQTNEQQFGLLSFDRHKIRVDGKTEEWKGKPIYEKKDGSIRSLYVDHDERYLYIRLDYDTSFTGYPMILLDVVPDQGNTKFEGLPNISFTNGIDFIVNLKESESRLLVDQYYDFFSYQYGHVLNLLKPKPATPSLDSGKFVKEQYALNKELYLPQQKTTLPFESYEAGKLKRGNGNPEASDYNSLADYYIADGKIELRIPWLLLRAKDPSQKEFMGDLYKDGIEASKFVDEIFVGALLLNEQDILQDTFPSMEASVLPKLSSYTWDKWDLPEYEERLKESYTIVQDLFGRYK
ncbi:MAG: hypothetical protein ABS898_08630 [Psychrobacillus sp.]